MFPEAEANRLEELLPKVAVALFRPSEADPMRRYPSGQVRLLRALLPGPKSASALAEELGLSPSAFSQMAARLISRGLVERSRDVSDHRVRWYRLSQNGQSMMSTRSEMRARAAARFLKRLGAERSRRLIAMLEEIAGQADSPAVIEVGA